MHIIKWNPNIELNDFYIEAEKRGFANNVNQKVMIDCFQKEKEWQVWLLQHNEKIAGSVAAHSIDEGYRICVRTCLLSNLLPINTLRTRNQIATHQHYTAQFFMPACLEWVNGRGDAYITSHPSEVGTQKLVHYVWGPTLEKTGVLTRAFEKEYRGHVQTFWKVNTDIFLDQLEKVKWKL